MKIINEASKSGWCSVRFVADDDDSEVEIVFIDDEKAAEEKLVPYWTDYPHLTDWWAQRNTVRVLVEPAMETGAQIIWCNPGA